MVKHGLGEPPQPAATRGASCTRACATAARSASRASTTGRIDGVHLCTTRLNLLQLNTMRALDPALLADVARAARARRRELRELGRLAVPDAPPPRRAGVPAASRWDEALDLDRRRASAPPTPDRLAFYLTARGITNEVYYVGAEGRAVPRHQQHRQRGARLPRAVDRRARRDDRRRARRPAPTPTSSSSDLIVLFGADVANAQPVFMKYLYLARKRGAKVAVVNPFREPGLERYWVPSNVESAMFGTKIADEFFAVHTGGDIAFLNGVLKVLLADGGVDAASSASTPTGFDELRARARARVVRRPRAAVGRDARRHGALRPRCTRRAPSAVLVWSMGITQHVAAPTTCSRDRQPRRSPAATSAARRAGSCRSAATPACRAARRWARTPPRCPAASPITPRTRPSARATVRLPDRPTRPGLTAAEMVEAARPRRDRRPLLERRQLPRGAARSRRRCDAALARVPLRVHQDIVVSTQMLVDPARRRAPARRRPATSSTAAAPRPRPSGASRSAPRSRARASARRAASGRSSSTSPRRVDPERARSRDVRVGPGDPRRDRAGRPAVRGHRAPRARRATRSSGAARASARAAASRRPTAGRTSSRSCPSSATCRHGRVRAQHAARQAVQLDGVRARRTRSPGASRDALFIARRGRDGARRCARATASSSARTHGRDAARACTSRPIRAGNVQMFFPEGNALLAAGRRDPARACPTTTRSSRSSRFLQWPDERNARASPWVLHPRAPSPRPASPCPTAVPLGGAARPRRAPRSRGAPRSYPRPHRSVHRSLRAGVKAVAISLGILGVTTLLELVVFVLSRSVALLADLIHNGGDASPRSRSAPRSCSALSAANVGPDTRSCSRSSSPGRVAGYEAIDRCSIRSTSITSVRSPRRESRFLGNELRRGRLTRGKQARQPGTHG